MRLAGSQARIGYKKSGKYGGRPSVFLANMLDRQFAVDNPDLAWVPPLGSFGFAKSPAAVDITYLPTREGFANLCVVIDLFSRRVVGSALHSRPATEFPVQALLSVIRRRKPKLGLLIHSNQGTQYTSREWAAFLREHGLQHSMSRRGNCHDNALDHCS